MLRLLGIIMLLWILIKIAPFVLLLALAVVDALS